MATLSNKIKLYVNAEVDFNSDVILQDDGNGAYIKEWNLDIAQPTDAQLSAVESDADKMERNLNVDQERINAYGNIKDQLDEIYHNIDAWRTRIAKIKTDNPKE
jgi:hypothetical protein|tara:strand:- start:50 stop:361 length:312 start_codon:yes stop_codon:yes gene_type:complete